MTEACELRTRCRQQQQDPEEPGHPEPGLDEESAVKEAGRCFVNNLCRSCDLCRYFCPDLCITRDEVSGHLEIDYDYCKGCGICAFICPKGAIKMVQEEERIAETHSSGSLPSSLVQ